MPGGVLCRQDIKEFARMEGEESESTEIIIAHDEANNKGVGKKQPQPRRGKPVPKPAAIDEQALAVFFRRLGAEQLHGELGLREASRAFIRENIVPLNNKHVPAFSAVFRTSLLRQELARFAEDPTVEGLAATVALYCRLNAAYRECAVNSPVLLATYQEFEGLWLQELQAVGAEGQAQARQRMAAIWREVPYQALKSFLSAFELRQQYQSLDAEAFLKDLTNDLFEGKIQQVVEYYSLFTSLREPGEEAGLLRRFEEEQLVPRLTKKDQLFTEYVVALMKQQPALGERIYGSVGVHEEEKLMALMGDDSSKHQRVVQRAMRRHYRDVVVKCKHWYVIEDKLSFSPTFTRWYAEQLAGERRLRGSESEGEEGETGHQDKAHQHFISEEERVAVSASILARLEGRPSAEILRNPLYEYDSFRAAELLMQEAKLTASSWKAEDFLSLQEESVIFIGQLDAAFHAAKKALLGCETIGFDSEFMPTESKFTEGGVSIIQLATPSQTFIFDYLHLRGSAAFVDFFIELMQSPAIVKVGHTCSSDLQYLNKNFPRAFQPRGLVDIAKLFRELHPQECYSSLAFLTQKFLQRQLCKYEQRSNWARRPLKKTQLHYAALDAHVCLLIYKHLDPTRPLPAPPGGRPQGRTEGEERAEFDFERYGDLLKEPKFLVDNMLKKLSSTLRNCGLDAEFISIRDHELALSQARRERRIIVTRDGKLAQRKGQFCPIYLLRERSDTEAMFEELLAVFRIDLSRYKTLSRCVKCNCDELLVISSEEAQAEIKFLYENNIREYWRCARCRQIYWEGGQFAKAKNKFDALRNGGKAE